MKKYLFLILITFSMTMAFAQRGERVEGIKIAFLAGKLNLDPKTAERFWPIYNQYDAEMRSLIQERRASKKDDNRNVEDLLDNEQKAIDLKRKYNAQFLKIISNEQLSTLYQAEKEFRQMILRRAKG